MNYKDRKAHILYSLARVLDQQLATYRPLPLLVEPTPDSVRDPPREVVQQLERRNGPQSFSSSGRGGPGGGLHVAPRCEQASNIDKAVVPKVETLDDLDLFYEIQEKTVVKAAATAAAAERRTAAAKKTGDPGLAFNSTRIGSSAGGGTQNGGGRGLLADEEDDLSTFSLNPLPLPGGNRPQPPPSQIVEGEDEESDQDDWDLIKEQVAGAD